MEFLWQGVLSITPQQLVMYVVGGLLIWLAIEKGFEPALLLPMGFGAILVNLPLSGVIDQAGAGGEVTHGIVQWLFQVGIEASEAAGRPPAVSVRGGGPGGHLPHGAAGHGPGL